MPDSNRPAEAQSTQALACAARGALCAPDREGLARAVLDAAVRPGAALAAAVATVGAGGVAGWRKLGPGLSAAPFARRSRRRGAARAPGEPRLISSAALAGWFPEGFARPVHGVDMWGGPGGGGGARVVLVFPGEPGALPSEEKSFASALADLVALGLARVRSQRRLEQMAIRDDLTHAFNFRYLKTALRKDLELSARLRRPMSLVMLDVDHLKNYNERFGHIAGSELLRELSEILARVVPPEGRLAKYGGDEFLVMLPGSGREEAMEVGERLRAAIAAHGFRHAVPGEVTASFGVASFPEHGLKARDLLAAADRALFWAKNSGRNRLGLALAG